MFDVFTNLRTSARLAGSTPVTVVNIRKSGWKLKCQGAPDELSDKAFETLVEAQPTADGKLKEPVKGTIESESHKAPVSFPALPLEDVLTTMRGEEIEEAQEEGDKDPLAQQKGETKRAWKARLQAHKDAEELKASRNGQEAGV